MTIGAGLTRRPGFRRPHRLAVEHRERGGIRRIVVLHRLGVAAHQLIAGAALALGLGMNRNGEQCAEHEAGHSGHTDREPESIATISMASTPLVAMGCGFARVARAPE